MDGPISAADLSSKSRIRMGVGKLWKLKMPFSRNWKVLERDDFYSEYGKVLDFFGKIVHIS